METFCKVLPLFFSYFVLDLDLFSFVYDVSWCPTCQTFSLIFLIVCFLVTKKSTLEKEVTNIYIVKCYSLLKWGCVGVGTQWVPGQESGLLFHPKPLNTASSFVQTAAGNCCKLCTPVWAWSTVSRCHRMQRSPPSIPYKICSCLQRTPPAILQPLAFPPNHHHKRLFN